ncbi:MAG: Hsp20/alpha crystallin family protein [Candidatus Hydrogenedentes bacterium]|nr:Hsp20/alpha crystallin family protein [Candidatus Hydrogenedentota bacterium]
MRSLIKRDTNELNPWATFRDLEEQFSQFFREFPVATGISAESSWVPAVDLTETADAYLLEADLPGMKREDIEVTVVDDVITLRGERKEEKAQEEKGYRRVERSYGSFQRSFRVPGGVDTGKVDAHFDQGVLKVSLPKRPEAKPKAIEVKVK